VSAALRKAWTLLAVMYAYMTEWRAELILWALANSLPFILMGVWVQAGTSGEFALGPDVFARYFLSVFVIRQLTVVWVIWEVEHEVVHGQLASRLLVPLDPVWRYIAGHVSERGARLPFALGLVFLFFLLYPSARFVPDAANVAIGLGFATLAFALRFVIQHTLAMLCFWTERASSAEQLWNLLFIFLSGYIAPLEVFPALVRDVAMLTPFPYLIYVPAGVIIGLEVDVVRALAVLCAWLVLFFIANRVLWRRGLKRFSAMGA
jgi:ABC-2 type transport system permease protein